MTHTHAPLNRPGGKEPETARIALSRAFLPNRSSTVESAIPFVPLAGLSFLD